MGPGNPDSRGPGICKTGLDCKHQTCMPYNHDIVYPWLRHTTGAYESLKISTDGDACFVFIIVVGFSYSTQPVAPPWETANDRIFRRIAKYDEALHAGIAEWRATQPPYSRPHSPPSDTLIREMEELEISPAFFEGPMYPTFPVDWTQKERGQMADAMAVCLSLIHI